MLTPERQESAPIADAALDQDSYLACLEAQEKLARERDPQAPARTEAEIKDELLRLEFTVIPQLKEKLVQHELALREALGLFEHELLKPHHDHSENAAAVKIEGEIAATKASIATHEETLASLRKECKSIQAHEIIRKPPADSSH